MKSEATKYSKQEGVISAESALKEIIIEKALQSYRKTSVNGIAENSAELTLEDRAEFGKLIRENEIDEQYIIDNVIFHLKTAEQGINWANDVQQYINIDDHKEGLVYIIEELKDLKKFMQQYPTPWAFDAKFKKGLRKDYMAQEGLADDDMQALEDLYNALKRVVSAYSGLKDVLYGKQRSKYWSATKDLFRNIRGTALTDYDSNLQT